MKCPKCESDDLEYYLTTPEHSSDTIIAKCYNCHHKITHGEIYGKIIHD